MVVFYFLKYPPPAALDSLIAAQKECKIFVELRQMRQADMRQGLPKCRDRSRRA